MKKSCMKPDKTLLECMQTINHAEGRTSNIKSSIQKFSCKNDKQNIN